MAGEERHSAYNREIDYMAEYPFDQNFADLVTAYQTHGHMWVFLFAHAWMDRSKPHHLDHFNPAFVDLEWDESAQVAFFDYLEKAGYDQKAIEEAISRVKTCSADELVELVLNDAPNKLSPALILLQMYKSREVFGVAMTLTHSARADERTVGVQILMRNPGLQFPDTTIARLKEMVDNESDSSVVEPIIFALCHHNVEGRAKLVHKFMALPNSSVQVREAIAFCLGGEDDETAIEDLIVLTKDQSTEVRNCATFSLGMMNDKDSDAIREALFERLSDEHTETQLGALCGLAAR
ncbi:MAG: hypothetical protein K2Z81_18920, partial [Cyanobacteria bacterium]|nr:hypothetical protein [Cyanobacteriota bacterium]